MFTIKGTAYDDRQTPHRDDGRLETVHRQKRGAAMAGSGRQCGHDLCGQPLFRSPVRPADHRRHDGRCPQPALDAGHRGGGAAGACRLYPRRGCGQLQRQSHCKKDAAQCDLRKTVAPGRQLHPGCAHRRGIAAGRRRRRAAGDLLWRVPAAVFLRHAGACHPVCGAGPGQCKGSGHPDDLRAADPGFHRGCAEICQAAAGQILGPVCRPGR